MKIDNFYFVVEDIEKSIRFYSELLEKKPTNIIENRWADWENENNQIYFGIISKKASESTLIKGNNGVLGLYTEDINAAYQKCLNLYLLNYYNFQTYDSYLIHFLYQNLFLENKENYILKINKTY